MNENENEVLDRHIGVRVTEKVHATLKSMAKEQKRDIGEIVRFAIDEHLEKQEKTAQKQ